MPSSIDKVAYLGFDIGGTAIKYGIGFADAILYENVISTPRGTLDEFIRTFHALVFQLVRAAPSFEIRGIGIATPGTIDRKSGLLKGVNPNLPWWVDINPLIVIPEEYRHLARCDNDANLMCLAEAAGKPGGTIGITVGTGIGSAYVENDRIFHGSHGFAMEAGHISVVPDGALCNCGLKGCVEAYASVTAIFKAASALKEEYDSFSLAQLIKASRQDAALKKVILEAEKYLGIALANLTMILDPKRIIIGGGGMDAGLYSVESLKKHILHYSQKAYHQAKVERARLGNKAGVMGALMLAALRAN